MENITTEEMITALGQTTTDLLNVIVPFRQDRFNVIPFEDSWTAAGVSEHLLKAEAGIPGILSDLTQPAGRPSDEKMEVIGSIFLDFTTRLKSPEAILPSGDPRDKEEVLKAFKTSRTEIIQVMRRTDLSRICTTFPFPVVGMLTGFEWIYFVICHSKRHTRQLKNIYQTLASAPNPPAAGLR